jgi:hypothetical protein
VSIATVIAGDPPPPDALVETERICDAQRGSVTTTFGETASDTVAPVRLAVLIAVPIAVSMAARVAARLAPADAVHQDLIADVGGANIYLRHKYDSRYLTVPVSIKRTSNPSEVGGILKMTVTFKPAGAAVWADVA